MTVSLDLSLDAVLRFVPFAVAMIVGLVVFILGWKTRFLQGLVAYLGFAVLGAMFMGGADFVFGSAAPALVAYNAALVAGAGTWFVFRGRKVAQPDDAAESEKA